MTEGSGLVNRRRRSNGSGMAAPRLSYGMLPDLVSYNLRKAQIAAYQDFQQTMTPLDLTPGQYGVLVLIRENGGLSQSDLGKALGIDRSTMVAVIDKLEAQNLVVRAPSPIDRRSYALKLSDEGERMMVEYTRRVRQHERNVVHHFSEDEQRLLLDMLRRIHQST